MFVMTMDQRGSRRTGDLVEPLLAELAHLEGAPGMVRPFARTVGDEVQAALDDPALAVELGLAVLRRGGWSVGIGVGPVELPLPADVRAATGEAFVLAREAVERAKGRGRPVPLAVAGVGGTAAADAEAVLVLLGSVASRRTEAGWAVVDALAPGTVTQEEVAERLGISQQAVSQRLRGALWPEEPPVRAAAARLLARAAEPEDR